MIALVSLFTAACECTQGDHHCSGNTAYWCTGADEHGHHMKWYSRNCADENKVCVDGEFDSFCAVAASPDPLCDNNLNKCDGETLLHCEEGYRTDEIACTQCIDTNLDAQSRSFCSLDSTPDPRCASHDAFCDGDVWVHCYLGYPTERIPCPNGPCFDVPDSYPRCALANTGYEPCPAEWFCAGDHRVECVADHVVFIEDCKAGTCQPLTCSGNTGTEGWELGVPPTTLPY